MSGKQHSKYQAWVQLLWSKPQQAHRLLGKAFADSFLLLCCLQKLDSAVCEPVGFAPDKLYPGLAQAVPKPGSQKNLITEPRQQGAAQASIRLGNFTVCLQIKSIGLLVISPAATCVQVVSANNVTRVYVCAVAAILQHQQLHDRHYIVSLPNVAACTQLQLQS